MFEATGDPQPLLNYAAKQCFWGLSQNELEQLATDLSCELGKVDLLHLLKGLLLKILGPLSQADLTAILNMRGQDPPTDMAGELPAEVLADVFDADDAEAVKDRRANITRLFTPCSHSKYNLSTRTGPHSIERCVHVACVHVL